MSPLVGLLDGSIRELDFENGKLGDNIGDAVDDNNEIDSGINNLKMSILVGKIVVALSLHHSMVNCNLLIPVSLKDNNRN